MSGSLSHWSSPYESWHARALITPHPDPHSFTPTRENLLLVMFVNVRGEGDGISLALFLSQLGSEETIAVDARGRVLIVSPKDTNGLSTLASDALTLPKTNNFWNTWSIKHNATCLANHRLFVLALNEDDTPNFRQITVYGFSKDTRELSEPVEGFSELPDTLWELFGLVLEARDGAGNRWDGVRDEVVLGKVREALKGMADAAE